MFEFSLQAERHYRMALKPGLYRLQLPENDQQQANIVEAALRDPTPVLCLPHTTAGSNVLLPQTGGIISNLRLWENIVLPRWYHGATLAAEEEARLLQWVCRLLPHVDDAASWLHQMPAQLQPEELALAGLLRALLAPAPCIWIEADWCNSLGSGEWQLCLVVLAEVLQEQQRLAVVFAADAQAMHAMAAWHMAALTEWESP